LPERPKPSLFEQSRILKLSRHGLPRVIARAPKPALAPGDRFGYAAWLPSFQPAGSVVTKAATPVAVIMGSQSDWATMRHAAQTLDALGVGYEARIVSAHRTPDRLVAFAKNAENEGFEIVIAGAGGAAHLPGMTAAMTALPVLGVPINSAALSGMDSLLSIVQMPAGVPVGTLAIGKAGAVNAALLAAAILSRGDSLLAQRLARYRAQQTESVGETPSDEEA